MNYKLTKNSKYNTCNICKGFGFIKIKTIYCKNCNGKICYLCQNKAGIIKGPWIDCKLCSTSGKILTKHKST